MVLFTDTQLKTAVENTLRDIPERKPGKKHRAIVVRQQSAVLTAEGARPHSTWRHKSSRIPSRDASKVKSSVGIGHLSSSGRAEPGAAAGLQGTEGQRDQRPKAAAKNWRHALQQTDRKSMSSNELAHRTAMSQHLSHGTLAGPGRIAELPNINHARAAEDGRGTEASRTMQRDELQKHHHSQQQVEFNNLLSQNLKMLQQHMERYNQLKRQRPVNDDPIVIRQYLETDGDEELERAHEWLEQDQMNCNHTNKSGQKHNCPKCIARFQAFRILMSKIRRIGGGFVQFRQRNEGDAEWGWGGSASGSGDGKLPDVATKFWTPPKREKFKYKHKDTAMVVTPVPSKPTKTESAKPAAKSKPKEDRPEKKKKKQKEKKAVEAPAPVVAKPKPKPVAPVKAKPAPRPASPPPPEPKAESESDEEDEDESEIGVEDEPPVREQAQPVLKQTVAPVKAAVKFKEAPKKATKAAADTRKREMEEMKRKKAAARALAAQEAEKRRDEELELPPLRAPTPEPEPEIYEDPGEDSADDIPSRQPSAASSAKSQKSGRKKSPRKSSANAGELPAFDMESRMSSRKSSANGMNDDFGGGFDQSNIRVRSPKKKEAVVEAKEVESDHEDNFVVATHAKPKKEKKKRRKKKPVQEKTKRTLKGVFTMVVACQFFKTVLKVVRDPNWVDPSLTKKKKRIVLKPKPKPAEEPQKKQYKKMSKDTGEKKPRFVIKARKRSIEDHSNETDDSEEDGESGDEFDADAQPHRRYSIMPTKKSKLEQYLDIFYACDSSNDGFVQIEELKDNITHINRDWRAGEVFEDAGDLEFINTLTHFQEDARRDHIDVKTFSIICALAAQQERVGLQYSSHPESIKAMNEKVQVAEALFAMVEPNEDGEVSAEMLVYELEAGGINSDVTRALLGPKGVGSGLVSFSDFMQYLPLFVEAHKNAKRESHVFGGAEDAKRLLQQTRRVSLARADDQPDAMAWAALENFTEH